jgi:hypothetical protein
MADENKTVDEHMADAIDESEEVETVEESSSDENSEESESGEESSDDESAEQEETEEETQDDEDDEVQKANKLWELLKNPKSQAATIKYLAEQAGLELAQQTRRGEEKPTASDLEVMAEEALGPDYKFLAKRFAGLLEKVIETKVKPETTKITEAQQVQQINEFMDVQLETFIERKDIEASEDITKTPILAEMHKIASKYPYQGKWEGKEYQAYLNDIHSLASVKFDDSNKKIKRAKKIQKNLEDSEPESVQKGSDKGKPKTIATVDDALREAMNEQMAQDV